MKKKSHGRNSLESKAFWTIVAGAAVFLLIISPFELIMHAYTIMTNYKRESRLDLAYAVSLIDPQYLEDLYKNTKEIYDKTPEELKQKQFTDEYRQIFVPLVDEQFLDYRRILVKCREEKELVNCYLIFTDEEKERFVFLIDGDKNDYAYLPGQWLSNENGEIEDLDTIDKIEESKWRLTITYGKLYGFTATNYIDLYDTQGNWIGYGVIDFSVNDFFQKLFDFLKIYIPFLVLIVTFGAHAISRILKRDLIVPLDNMANVAREYTARDKVKQTNVTHYFSNLKIDTNDEIQDLWESMVNMETDISETMIRIREVTEAQAKLQSKQDRINNELSIATRIQEGILPRNFPAFPDRTEFDIYASMIPAQQVGGDLYDFFLVDEDHLGLVMADVSGKGISASLFMTMAKTLIQNEAIKLHGRPGEVLKSVNAHLMSGNEAEMFVTVWFGVLDISTGNIVYSNAGHEYPAICKEGGKFELFKDIHGLPVAAMENAKFREGEFHLDPGDTLFVYTDGVTDANNPQKERFDIERMLEALNIKPDGTPKEINDNVRGAINQFMDTEPQFDDTTMMVVRYYGPADRGEESENHAQAD